MDNKEILKNAPEGATHISADGAYILYRGAGIYEYKFDEDDEWQRVDCMLTTRKLSDIKRIAGLEKERDELLVRVTNCEQVFSDAPDLEFSRFKEMFPDEFEAHNLEEREESVANFCCWLIDNGEPIPEEQLQKYGSDYIECARRQAAKLKEGE